MASLLDETFARPAGDTTEIVEDESPGDDRETLTHRAGRALAALSPVGKAEAATGAEASAPRRHGRAADGWSIQVGAFTQHDAAEQAAEQALLRIARAKGRAVHVVDPARADKDKMYRARIVHFTHRDAEAACRSLHRKHKSCAVIAPEAQVASAAK